MKDLAQIGKWLLLLLPVDICGCMYVCRHVPCACALFPSATIISVLR